MTFISGMITGIDYSNKVGDWKIWNLFDIHVWSRWCMLCTSHRGLNVTDLRLFQEQFGPLQLNFARRRRLEVGILMVLCRKFLLKFKSIDLACILTNIESLKILI